VSKHLEGALKQNVLLDFVPTGDHDLYAVLVDSAAQQRNQQGLQKYAPLAEETAAHIGHNLYLGIAHRAWGIAHTLAGEHPQAEARFQQAQEIFAMYPAPWQVGRNLLEMGELARAQMQTEQARDYFSRALNAFEELHATPWAARTRVALKNLSKA
jgi:tetratricopeptide (TPR) repeat protein